jgi:hypothetical protein
MVPFTIYNQMWIELVLALAITGFLANLPLIIDVFWVRFRNPHKNLTLGMISGFSGKQVEENNENPQKMISWSSSVRL